MPHLKKTYKSTIYSDRGTEEILDIFQELSLIVCDLYINTDVSEMGPTSANR